MTRFEAAFSRTDLVQIELWRTWWAWLGVKADVNRLAVELVRARGYAVRDLETTFLGEEHGSSVGSSEQ